jgi:hypothetical protein
MLNELYTLEQSLTRFQVSVEESHPWVQHLGRGDVLIAGVDSEGLVTRVEHRSSKEELLQVKESNQARFPEVNWSAPMCELEAGSHAFEAWQACPEGERSRRAKLLREACEGATMPPEQARLVAKVRRFCQELLPRFTPDATSEFAAFPVLLERILREDVSGEGFARSLASAMLRGAGEGIVPLATVETLIAGDLRKPDREAKVAILFDLADCTKFQCRVASPRMGRYFSQILNATEMGGASTGLCALSGTEMPLAREKLPNPSLPVVGPTYLMAMNKDTPCQTRYRRIGMQIFPIGERTANALDGALKYITKPERKGKNWEAVPGNTGKKPNLLLVYLESMPEFEAPIAELFTGGEESEAHYEALCQRVCESLRGRGADQNDLLRLFVLNKIDDGRRQVELSEAFTAAQVIQGGTEWQQGTRNRPLLPLKDDFIPSPTEVMRCLQKQWEMGGVDYADAPGCDLADVYDILIAGRSGTRRAATLLLRLALNRTTELLLAIGHAAHRGGKEAWKGIDGKSAMVSASILGVTLQKLGSRKEEYMQEPAFLIGRFLSLTDTLHLEYCKEVRKGDLPPQLLGNALMPTAIADPNKGFARMLHRLKPYQAWARTKGSAPARWACAEMGKIANDIAGSLGESRLSEAQQAQLLLGYLARTEKSEEGAQQ